MHRRFHRPTLLLAMLLPLACGGCAVGDGVAQAVKWTSRETAKQFQDKPAEPAPPVATAAARPAPPRAEPPAAAAAPRDDIQVETLPPRR
jgi:hypothetical protein